MHIYGYAVEHQFEAGAASALALALALNKIQVTMHCNKTVSSSFYLHSAIVIVPREAVVRTKRGRELPLELA
jgi:hypothetical protein